MPLTDIATVNVSSAGAGVTRAGYGVPLILSYSAQWVERQRVYSSLSAVGQDFPTNSPEYLAAQAIFSQQPKVTRIRIGRGALLPTQQFALGIQAAALNTPYRVRVGIPTGSAWVSQDATYNSGQGATVWGQSGVWSSGDLIAMYNGSSGYANLFSCLGKSGPSGIGGGLGGGFTGIGAASGAGPSGIGAAIQEGQIFWMYVGTGQTGASGIVPDAIIQGLRTKVEALQAPPVVGVGAGQLISSLQGAQGARTLQLLANAPAKFFGLQVYDRNVLNLRQNHADPGVATDLAAIKLESNDWYGLVTLFNSELLVDAAAAWVEANTKLYAAASHDTRIARDAAAIATDVGHDLKAAGYARSWVFHHPSNDQFADAAEMGKFFPVSPGGETWRMKTLAGVTVESYSDTEIQNMKDKHVQYYYDLGGVSVVGGDAMTGAGEYVDVTRFIDWYTSELQARLANLAIARDKIPFTNQGIALVGAKVEAQNLAGIRAGGIAPDPAPIVTLPDISNVSTEDKQDRELSGVTSEWTLAGAIHHITVTVTANP